MNNHIIERCELLLGRMEALEERSTKGEWLYRCHSECIIQHHVQAKVDECGKVYTVATPVHSNEQTRNNMELIAFAHNHSKTERELVREVLKSLKACDTRAGDGLQNICFGRYWAKILCRICGDRTAALTRWADSTEAELGKVGA